MSQNSSYVKLSWRDCNWIRSVAAATLSEKRAGPREIS